MNDLVKSPSAPIGPEEMEDLKNHAREDIKAAEKGNIEVKLTDICPFSGILRPGTKVTIYVLNEKKLYQNEGVVKYDFDVANILDTNSLRTGTSHFSELRAPELNGATLTIGKDYLIWITNLAGNAHYIIRHPNEEVLIFVQ